MPAPAVRLLEQVAGKYKRHGEVSPRLLIIGRGGGMAGWMNEGMDGCFDGWMDEWREGLMVRSLN